MKENTGEEILKLKQQPGKDLAVFGSSDLALTLIQLGLIDEYRIIVNPVVLRLPFSTNNSKLET